MRAASNFTPNFLVLQTGAACLMGERALKHRVYRA